MTLKAVHIRNFRGFKDTSLELKPLTVLMGPNSAGKSTFGHALAALAHAHSQHKDTGRASLSPRSAKDAEQWPVDLGDYADLRTNNAKGPVCIGLHTESGCLEFGFGDLKGQSGLILSYFKHPQGADVNTPVQPDGDSSVLSPEGFPSGTYATNPTQISSSAKGLVLRRVEGPDWKDDQTDQPMRVGLNGLLVETIRHETGTDLVLDNQAQRDLRTLFERIIYLRANRKRPLRGYECDSMGNDELGYAGDWLGYAGEWTASRLKGRRGKNGPSVNFRRPPSIAKTVAEAKKLLDVSWGSWDGTLQEAVGLWFEYLGLARNVETRGSRRSPERIDVKVALHDPGAWRDITEIGFGISQVLPVLVGGLLQKEGGLFIVDLPEAHLHPKPQAELADFFCSLALSGRPCLVETHSEMFFHRLRLRAAMNSELMEKIAVYFCDPPAPDGLCRSPRRVGLSFEDELKWPQGFLQEAWEMESEISIIREARRAASNDQAPA